MKPLKPAPSVQERPKQEVPLELVNDMVRAVRQQFCADIPEKAWFKDNFHFIRKTVVMWPAAFMSGKGFTLPPERFKAILYSIFSEVKTHGNTGSVTYWPAYLAKCVQTHFRIHWEEYYNEAKAIRNKVEAAMFAVKRTQGEASGSGSAVEAIAMAHKVATGSLGRKKSKESRSQMSLF